MSLQRLGPVWKGDRLRLERPDELGLRFPVLIGWSDFYGGTPASVAVAWASDGERSGWVVWGGSQGLRAVPESAEGAAEVMASATFEERPLVWIGDLRMLPAEVASVVAREGDRPTPAVEARSVVAPRGVPEVRAVGDGKSGTTHGDAWSAPRP